MRGKRRINAGRWEWEGGNERRGEEGQKKRTQLGRRHSEAEVKYERRGRGERE